MSAVVTNIKRFLSVYFIRKSMSIGKPLVYVVVEKPNTGNHRVKAVFESKEAAQDAIEQEFSDRHDYEIVRRTLYKSITDSE